MAVDYTTYTSCSWSHGQLGKGGSCSWKKKHNTSGTYSRSHFFFSHLIIIVFITINILRRRHLTSRASSLTPTPPTSIPSTRRSCGRMTKPRSRRTTTTATTTASTSLPSAGSLTTPVIRTRRHRRAPPSSRQQRRWRPTTAACPGRMIMRIRPVRSTYRYNDDDLFKAAKSEWPINRWSSHHTLPWLKRGMAKIFNQSSMKSMVNLFTYSIHKVIFRYRSDKPRGSNSCSADALLYTCTAI